MKETFNKYLREKELLDKPFIEKYIKDYIWKNSLDDELQCIQIENKAFNMSFNNIEFKEDYAYYCYDYRTLFLYINDIYSDLVTRLNINEVSYENILKLNMAILTIITHELIHAKQFKISNNSLNLALRKTLHTSFDHAFNNYDNYLKNHDKYIHEYNANILSQIEVYNFLNDSNFNIIYSQVIKDYLQGYLNNKIPIIEFYKMINEPVPNFNEFIGFNTLSNFDKLTYGFDVSNDVKEKIKTLDSATDYKEHFERR